MNTVVVFTYIDATTNVIYRMIYDESTNQLNVRILAKGNFGITKNAQIQGLFVYEHSELQKVYWVDGVNQLRYLNISDSSSYLENNQYITEVNRLNSCPEIKLDHHMEVIRKVGGGVFDSGVIQYAFTYFNKYGAETNIVDMSPLYYIGEENRGVPADESVGCSFEVTIYNPDTSFDYIRVYSIQRQTLNGEPLVKKVHDIKLK